MLLSTALVNRTAPPRSSLLFSVRASQSPGRRPIHVGGPLNHQPHGQPSYRPTLASHASTTPPPQRPGKPASLMSVTIHESQMMPAYAADTNDLSSFTFSQTTCTPPARSPSDRSLPARENREIGSNGSTAKTNGGFSNGTLVMQSVPNGRPTKPSSIDKRMSREERPASTFRPDQADAESLAMSPSSRGNSSELLGRDDGYFASTHTSETKDRLCGSTKVQLGQINLSEGIKEAQKDLVPHHGHVASSLDAQSPPPQQPQASDATANLQVPGQPHRVSSPPAFNHNAPSPSQHPYRLQQRHTLEVPKLSTSRAREAQNNTDDVISASGRFSPTNTPQRRRGSISLVRRGTRSINSDMHLDEVPPDEDAARWAEHIRQKRASKRKRKEDEDEDRVVVGTKVDQNHVNWVTAYNMLTGIRFTVSRTNAKTDRDLTEADFDAKHKFSFDMYVPAGFPFFVKHLLEFNFASSGRPVLPNLFNDTDFSVEPVTSLRPLPNTTSSSRTTRPGSSAIYAPLSS